MIKLMTSEEVQQRLSAGESPLELSIKKWERLEKAHEEGQEVKWHKDISADTCALCIQVGFCYEDDEDNNCDEARELCLNCPYFLHYGHRCDSGGHWTKAIQALWKENENTSSHNDVKEAFHGMTEALKAIKDVK